MTTTITVTRGSTEAQVERMTPEITVVVPVRVPDGEAGGWSPPPGGIPKTELAAPVRASLGLADTSVQPDDPRLSDARPPTAHTHPATEIAGASPVGRAVLTAADQVAARAALGTVSTVAWQQHLVDSAEELAAKADLVDGRLVTSQLPVIPEVSTTVVQTLEQRLALTDVGPEDRVVQVLDPARGTYFLTGPDASVPESWTLAVAPTDAVSSVNGQSGIVVLGRSDVGLGQVDNTPDLDKPVSTAAAAAIGQRAPKVHVHAIGDIDGLTAALAGKADDADLDGKLSITHPADAGAGKVWTSDADGHGSWQPAASGGGAHGAEMWPGVWYPYDTTSGASTSNTPALNQLMAARITIGRDCTLTEIGVNVATAVAGSTMRLVILELGFDGTTWTGTVLADAGLIDGSTTGPKTLPIDVPVSAGQPLLLGAVNHGVAASVTATLTAARPGLGAGATFGGSVRNGYQANGVTDPLPGTVTFHPTGLQPTVPLIWVRANA